MVICSVRTTARTHALTKDRHVEVLEKSSRFLHSSDVQGYERQPSEFASTQHRRPKTYNELSMRHFVGIASLSRVSCTCMVFQIHTHYYRIEKNEKKWILSIENEKAASLQHLHSHDVH